MRLRIFTVALIVAAQVIGAAPQSKAESGWAWRNKTWVQYSFIFTHPQGLKGKGLVVLRQTQRQEAIRLAVMDWRAYEKRLRALLLRAQSILSQGRAIVNMTVDWYRVAMCEEGGNWYYNGPSFVGGLGFRRTTWTYWAPKAGQPASIPSSGFYSPSIQIAVAEYMVHHGIAAPYFPGPQCSGYNGW